MVRRFGIGLWVAVSFLLFACGEDSKGGGDSEGEEIIRTVVVYLGVDNNFTQEAQEKIETLRRNWNAGYRGNLLVYADNGNAVLVRIHRDDRQKNVADTLKWYGEVNSADPAVLKRVLTDVVEEFPAPSYGMVVLSHGTGWLPAGSLTRPASVINDGGKEMELAGFVEAIPVKLDFLIFDACFMGSVEVGYELKEKAAYLVASPAEVIVSGSSVASVPVAPGFIYESMMQHLMKKEADVVAVAEDFYNHYNALSGLWRSATVSVVKTEALEAVAEFAAEVIPERGNNGAWSGVQSFGYGSHLLFFDFGDYMQKLVPERAGEFMKLLERAVVYKAHTPGYYSEGNYSYNPIRVFSGMSTYVPQDAYPLLNVSYRKLKWAQRVYR